MNRTFLGSSLLRTAGRVFLLATLAGSVACGGCEGDTVGNNNNNNSGDTTGTTGGTTGGPDNQNNNTRGTITVSPTNLQVNENGGTADFTIVLDDVPTGTVTIALVSTDESEATVSPASITFDESNWDEAQTITVTGVDDSEVDGNQTVTIQTNVTGTGNYEGVDAADVTVIVVDDDVAIGGSVMPTALTISEGGAAGTFTVVLASAPSGDVQIPISVSDDTEITIDRSGLTFTPDNFSTPQTVSVTAVDDDDVEGLETFQVILGAATGGGYDGLDLDDVTVTVVDNDLASIVVDPRALTTSENQTSATFTVTLGAPPTDDVVITATSTDMTEVTVDGPFTLNAGELTATFTVTGEDDDIPDGPQTVTINLDAVSNDPAYDGYDLGVVLVTNQDNDLAGINVSETNLTVNEAGETSDTFTVALSAAPGGTLTIALALSDATRASLSTTTLTFDDTNFGTAQTVTVSAIDDDFANGNAVVFVTGAVNAPAGSAFVGTTFQQVAVTVIDDDQAGITVNPTSGLVTSEAGGTASFTIVLNAAPTGDVTIPLHSDDEDEGTINVSSVTFTAENWDQPQTVTITGVDDAVVDGNVSYTIVTGPATSTDPAYNGFNAADVSVVNTDDDEAGFIVNPTSGLRTSEDGGQATFTVALLTEPSADVVIPMQSTDTSEGTVSPASLTFTPADWATPQTVTITGVDDNDPDGPIAYTIVLDTTTSADSAYHALDPPNVSVTNDDNEAGFTIIPPASGVPVVISETGSAVFGVRLNSAPTANVEIVLGDSAAFPGQLTDEYDLDKTSLIFTPQNFLTVQNVTISGVQDGLLDGEQNWEIAVDVGATADTAFSTLAAQTLPGVTQDADAPSVNVSPTSFALLEGGTCELVTISLSTPAGAATRTLISLPADSRLELRAPNGTTVWTSPHNLQFNSNHTSRTFYVCAPDLNDTAEPNTNETVTLGAFTSTNMAAPYIGIDPADLTVTINDDDTPAVLVEYPTLLGGGIADVLVTGENWTNVGAIDTLQISLASEPVNPVTVTFTSTDATEVHVLNGTTSAVGPQAVLVFDNTNWQTQQWIRVIGQDDLLADGTQVVDVNVSVASSDALYGAVTVPPITVYNLDDDTQGWDLVPLTNPMETTEAGGFAAYAVFMKAGSAQPVDVTVVLDDDTEAEIIGCATNVGTCGYNAVTDEYTLTYPANVTYALGLVVVGGVDDAEVDGNQPWRVEQTNLTTADPYYVTTTFPTALGQNLDDDSVGFIYTSWASSRQEGQTDVFRVGLASQPTADVTVTITTTDATEAEITAPASGTLTFTTTNWNTTQPATWGGVIDNVIDGPQQVDIVFTASSTDPAYNGLVEARTVTVTDIDAGGLLVDTNGSIVTNESGTTHEIEFRLRSQPTANVVIPLYSMDTTEQTISPASLTFTPSNWDTVQIATVTGVDDAIVDTNQTVQLLVDLAVSTDPIYSGVIDVVDNSVPSTPVVIGATPFFLSGQNNDNDALGIIVSQPTNPSFLVTDEDGLADTFQIVLASQPSGDVTIDLGNNCSGLRCVSNPANGNNYTSVTISPAQLTFDASNWSTPQTVTVTGRNNSATTALQWYYVDATVNTASMTRDNSYDGFDIQRVNGVNIDNDNKTLVALSLPMGRASSATTAAILQGVVTGENGAAGTVWVRGTQAPSSDVTVTVTASNGEAVPSTSSITLTSSNFRDLQAVSFVGQDDGNSPEVGGYTAFNAVFTPTAGDTDYSNTATVPGYNIDNDVCRVLLLPPTTTAANDRLDLQDGIKLWTPAVAVITANPSTGTTVETTLTSPDADSDTTSFTFSAGAAPQLFHLSSNGTPGDFTATLAVDAGDACFDPMSSPGPGLLYGTINP